MMQKFIIQQIFNFPAQVTIKAQDARHIHKVLRLGPGSPISLTDGQGNDYTAKIVSVSKENVLVDVISSHDSTTESPLEITLCSGMLKDKKMDFIIKHVTQLGICKWIPFYSQRSVPSPNAKRVQKRKQRWDTISKESLKQCRRSRLPEICDPINFDQLMTESDHYDLKIAFWEKAEQNLNTIYSLPAKKVMILIGPEGGFSDNEIQQARDNNFSSYLLGPRILRAETASISACTLIQHILGDI